MTLLFVYVAIALVFSFLCSVLEAVLLSVTPGYLARMQQDEHPAAERLVQLKTHVDRPLAAILSLNTIAHTVGAAGAGAQAQVVWGSDVLAITSAVLTLLILVLSEIIPKTLGANHWRLLAPLAARILPVIIVALYPLVILSELMTRALGKRKKTGLSRDEIAAVAQLAAEQGLFGSSESRILKNLFRFAQLRVLDVMTPRPVVESLPAKTTVEEMVGMPGPKRFSRIPVWEKNDDDVVGYILKDDVLLAAARDQLDMPVGKLQREMVVVPETLSLAAAFEQLLDRREQMALAVDEFGGVAGVITLEDVVETLLGLEIMDEHDEVHDMREMARRKWRKRALRLGILQEEEESPGEPE